jgi:hypothetical protein
MRILLDQNLSPKLIRRLADILPGLETVYDHDLIDSSDTFIFDWARRSEFSALVSADQDFVHLAERLVLLCYKLLRPRGAAFRLPHRDSSRCAFQPAPTIRLLERQHGIRRVCVMSGSANFVTQ